MGKIAPSAAPAWAIATWTDANNLYFELGGQNGPVVISFPRTADGFQRALAVLFMRHEMEGHGEPYTRAQLDRDLSPIPNRDGVSLLQRNAARDILKRLKIT